MIECVLESFGLDNVFDRTKIYDTPAVSTELLDNDPDRAPCLQSWNYRSAVGTLSYLQAMVRPDINFSAHHCAHFCNNPRQQHKEAVKRICRYLLRTKNKVLILTPDKYCGLGCFVDADWAGSWQDRSSNDPLSAHSRSGYVIMFAGCPIIWGSKMQYLISLSTTEVEYIALSSSLCEVIYVLNILNEFKLRNSYSIIPLLLSSVISLKTIKVTLRSPPTIKLVREQRIP